MFYKESKTEPKRTSRKNTEDVQGQLQSPCLQIEKAHLHKSQSYQAVNVLWQNIGTLDMHQKTMDESLLKKWNHDLLMDHKHLVLMVFEQDRIAGRPFFNHKQTLLHGNSTLQEEKTLPKAPAKEVKINQTNSSYTHKSLIAVQQASKQHQQVCQISPSSFPLNDSISEAAMLFADLSNDTKMPSKKKVFKTGPDPTQLASVLLDLRDEVLLFLWFFFRRLYSCCRLHEDLLSLLISLTLSLSLPLSLSLLLLLLLLLLQVKPGNNIL